MWTKKYGVITEVDCKDAGNAQSQACLLIKGNSVNDLMTAGTNNPIIQQSVVFRTASGDELIMKAW
jgi:hypothetical protein